MATPALNTGNANRIREAFTSWGANNQPFFDLVADEVTWRIIGSTRVSGTHRSKQAFVQATAPLAARFNQPSKVIIRSVHEVGDTIFLQWEGLNRSVSGRAYHQTYCWVMRMEEGQAVEVTAYLDTALVDHMFID